MVTVFCPSDIGPTNNVKGEDVPPDATGTLLTVIVELGSVAVGDSVIVPIAFVTSSVYEVTVLENAGLKFPALIVRLVNVASDDAARVTVMVYVVLVVPS